MSVLAAILIVAAAGLLIVVPMLGAATFSRKRAHAVMRSEQMAQPEQIQQLRARHPELIKEDRLDRHESYRWIAVSLWVFGWGVLFIGPTPGSKLTLLPAGTQSALGICILVGSTLMLVGSVLGARVGPFRVMRSVSDNIVSPLLGDDIRIPYLLAWFGMLSIAVSMCFYVTTVTLPRLVGSLGGCVAPVLIAMCITLGARMLWRLNKYAKARHKLICEVLTRIEGSE